jgi:hypothetical protein
MAITEYQKVVIGVSKAERAVRCQLVQMVDALREAHNRTEAFYIRKAERRWDARFDPDHGQRPGPFIFDAKQEPPA